MDEDIYYLNKVFYSRLYDNIEKKKKRVDKKSIIISLLNTNSSNVRFRLLNDSAVHRNEIDLPSKVFANLLNNKLIRKTDSFDTYVITGIGVWRVETENKILNEEILIGCLDESMFNPYTDVETSISPVHKVLLFSMIAARAFSTTSSVDLKMDMNSKHAWQEIIQQSYELLHEIRVIPSITELMKKGNENPVSNLYRHTDKLPRQTKGFFMAAGKQKYYLNIMSESNELSKEGLLFILRKIFEDKLLIFDEIDKIHAFCCDIARSKNNIVFPKEHTLWKAEYDIAIRDALFKLNNK